MSYVFSDIFFVNAYFLKEEINTQRKVAIFAVIISSLYLLFNLQSFPWIGLLVAFFWSFYNLLRKKINVDTDVGLFIESLFMLPLALIVCFFIYESGNSDFNLSIPINILMLFLGGVMTVIPLFLFINLVTITSLLMSLLIYCYCF